MRQIITKVYSFNELSDDAKSRAREKMREQMLLSGEPELDYSIEWIETAGKLLGIEFATKTYATYGGGTGSRPAIYYSGFSSQGDGACFEGNYSYAKGAAKAIRKEFGGKYGERMAEIATELQALQASHAYRLTAKVTQRSNYMHSGTMRFAIDNGSSKDLPEAVAEALKDLLRDFADAAYSFLMEEYDSRLTDEAIESDIESNDYEFDEHGNVA